MRACTRLLGTRYIFACLAAPAQLAGTAMQSALAPHSHGLSHTPPAQPPRVRTHRRHVTSSATIRTPPQPADAAVADSQQGGPTQATSAYVHLPFCKRKCWYCDFPVQAVGSQGATPSVSSRMETYVQQVCQEISVTARHGTEPLQTVYFGGGTPSLVPPELIARILHTLDKRYGISTDAEISLEADPGTFDTARLKAYMSLGVNRVSMGVQSFQQELLDACGRSHGADDIQRAIDSVRDSGVRSWSLDLISGLPHLTTDRWLESLHRAIQANPTHISVYDLQVEEGTPFARWYSPGMSPLPSDEQAAEMYAAASHTLRSAGYEHYEVSNYAKPGFRSRHNQVYWSGAPYYAFGQGAASYLSGRRFTRPATGRGYAQYVTEMTAQGSDVLPGAHIPPQSQEDRLLEWVMVRLRTSDGLDLTRIARECGEDTVTRIQGALRKHVASGHVLVQATTQTHMPTLTDTNTGAIGPGLATVDGSDNSQAVCCDESSNMKSVFGAALAGAPCAWVTGQHAVAGASGSKEWQRVRLSDPDGFLMSNDIISDVFAALSDLSV